MNYVVSTATIYDSDNELFETKIGDDTPQKNLLFSVWGKSKEESRKNADLLAEILNKLLHKGDC